MLIHSTQLSCILKTVCLLAATSPLFGQAPATCDFDWSPTEPCPGEEVSFNVKNSITGHIYAFHIGSAVPASDSLIWPAAKRKFSNPTLPTGQVYEVTMRVFLSGALVCSIKKNLTVKQGPEPMLSLPIPYPAGFDLTGNTIAACNLPFPITLPVQNTSPTRIFHATDTIQWGDGTTPTTFFPNTPSTEHPYQTLNNGFAFIKVIAKHNSGCTASKDYVFYSGKAPGGGVSNQPFANPSCAPFSLDVDISDVATNTQGTTYAFQVNGKDINTYGQQDVPSKYTFKVSESSCGKIDPVLGIPNVYSLSLIISNPCDLQKKPIAQVKVEGPPTAKIGQSGSAAPCPGVVYTFSDKSFGGGDIKTDGSCDSTHTFRVWKITGGVQGTDWTLSAGSLGSPSMAGSASISIKFLKSITYSIHLDVGNNTANSCGTSQTEIQVVIQPEPKVVLASANVSGNQCAPVSILVSALGLHTYSAQDSITWQVLNYPSLTPATTASIGNLHAQNTIVNLTQAGTFLIRVIAKNACDTARWEKIVTVFDKPKANPIINIVAPCEGTPITFSPASLGVVTGGLPCQCRYLVPGILDQTLDCSKAPRPSPASDPTPSVSP